ncbi:MAG: hypothetical protein Q6364_09255, partial [Candidatus Hermodarchaeota archaeon]|nr:hypothetical protein [Candidatus Hermodarchaeota archaeon]
MKYIPLLAKVGKSVPGACFLGEHLVSDEFERAVSFLYQESAQPTSILGGVIVLSGILFTIMGIVLSVFLNLVSTLILSVTITSMFGLIQINSISTKYHHAITQIERHAPYVLEELATIFLATGSVFESIHYVSRGEYDQISIAFSKMISPLNRGVAPEQLLMDFANQQPSITLRRGLLTFIQLVEASNNSLDAVIGEAHENIQRHYERMTMQWESRMMVYSGLLVFLPIIILLGAAIRGFADNPLI